MIDTVLENERRSIIDFLAGDSNLSLPEARFCIEKSDRVIVYKDDIPETVGCGTFRQWGQNKDKADVYLYVSPAAGDPVRVPSC